MRYTALCVIFIFVVAIHAEDATFGNTIAAMSNPVAARLAKRIAPDENGAMGRNRNAYFHVRFQLGLHHLADYGLAEKLPQAVGRFLDAAEYSFRYQEDDGGFKVAIPTELSDLGPPSQADRASGIAFFMYSLGSGVHALETNRWFTESDECKALRARLAALKIKLPNTLSYLLKHRDQLKLADGAAPNRLLFNGLAFYSLGRILASDDAMKAASEFVVMATRQVHEQGYFIEGGGFDSSYNGVAVALGFRLLLMGYSKDELDPICRKAIRWQQGSISDAGEILTDGNTRVNPDMGGESFLGRTKDVDVAHTIEALLLASLYLNNKTYGDLAEKVYKYYREDRK